MSENTESEKKRIGLALSGGGYRAAAYHLGTFRKLNEMGLLDEIDIISSNSGGSITNAYYATTDEKAEKTRLEQLESGMKEGLQRSIIKGILKNGRFILIATCILMLSATIIGLLFRPTYSWVSLVLLVLSLSAFARYQFWLLPISKINEELYNKFFFKGKKICDFTESPTIVINSTNTDTGRLFTFSQKKMNDSRYEYPKEGKKVKFEHKEFPVARAVAASTCVPFAFTPVTIGKKFFSNPSDFGEVHPTLIDGGVYDNQGIHKLLHENIYQCDHVIVSDAGLKITGQHLFSNTVQLLTKTSDIFMARIKHMQMSDSIYREAKTSKTNVAYFSLGWDLKDSIPEFISMVKKGCIPDEVLKHHGITSEEIEEAKKDKTNEIKRRLRETIAFKDIDDFIDYLKDKEVPEKVLKEHNITQKELENIKADHTKKIRTRLLKNVDYESIIGSLDGKLELARSVKTGLSTLSIEKIDALANHASAMTELHVKLYCPMLLKKEEPFAKNEFEPISSN